MSQQNLPELLELLCDLDALLATYRTNKIVFYRPIGQQPAFHSGGRAFVRVVLGANRSGKSVGGACEAIAHSLGYRPWLPESHPDRTVSLPDGSPIPVPNVGRVLAQNYEHAIKQTIWGKYEEWAPKHLIKKVHYNQRQVPTQIDWANGSVTYFMSNDQKDMVFEGTNGHWFWVDEPCDYSKYVGLKRGLTDFGGHCWMTLTPLTQPWIYNILVSRAGDDDDDSVLLYKLSIWDNCIDNGGHLSRAAINEFLKDLREEEMEARLHGNFLHLAGRVFKAWQPTTPYWVNPHPIPRTWPRVCVIDPHKRKPCAVLWAAITPDDRLIVYRTLFDKNLPTISDVADRMKELEGWFKDSSGKYHPTPDTEPVMFRIIDTSSKETDATSGSSVYEAFANADIYCALAHKRNAQAGYDAIHTALKVDTEWGSPGIVVHNVCSELKHDFMNFCYEDWQTARMRDLKGEREDYRKYDDDFIDCLRYIFQMRITYVMLRREMVHQARDESWAIQNGRVGARSYQ